MKTTILDYTIEYDVRKEKTVSYSKVVGTDIAGSEITASAKEGEKGAKKSTKTNLFVDVKIGEDMEGNAIIVSGQISSEESAEGSAQELASQNVGGLSLAVEKANQEAYEAKKAEGEKVAKEKAAKNAEAKELENQAILAYQAIAREVQGFKYTKKTQYPKLSEFSEDVIAESLKKYYGGKTIEELKKEALSDSVV